MADDSAEPRDATEFPSVTETAKKMIGFVGNYIPLSKHATESQESADWDDAEEYNFNHQSRGVALIINNETFQGHSQRRGSDLDALNLDNTCRHLGFRDIRHKKDMSASDMEKWLLSVAQEDHTEADCLVCAISSHGDEYIAVDDQSNRNTKEDIIYGTDIPILTRVLVESFSDSNCPTLQGKPRIFIIQACRGTKLDSGVVIQKDMDETDSLSEPPITVSPSPCFKDFFIVYATPPGYFAFRRPSEGSWFVTALNDVIQTIDPNKIDLTHLMTRVINNVAEQFQSSSLDLRIHAKKQTPCVYSMLTKDVYFKSKKRVGKKVEEMMTE